MLALRVLNYLLTAFSGPGAGFMFGITAVMAFALAVGIERSWLFWLRWACDSRGSASAMSSGDSGAAVNASGPLAGEVLQVGLSRDSDTREAMENATVLVEERIYRRLGLLSAAANVATMLGLLGTVYGLIVAFSSLGESATGQAASALSEGIATAMATTAYGLLVAIPATALHAILEARAEQLMASVEYLQGELLLHLPRLRGGEATEA